MLKQSGNNPAGKEGLSFSRFAPNPHRDVQRSLRPQLSWSCICIYTCLVTPGPPTIGVPVKSCTGRAQTYIMGLLGIR